MSPDTALAALIQALQVRGYCFVTPTPLTHARVVGRPDREEARSLGDVLGWSLPFSPGLLDEELTLLLKSADALEPAGEGRLRSRYRVSSLGGELYLHSAYPTDAKESVFFGPDSYRFAALIEAELERDPPGERAHIVDIGTGSGVGGIVAARRRSDARVTMTDVNPDALRLATINAHAAGIAVQTVLGRDLTKLRGAIDVALANPPYIIDDAGRAYRDGGGMLGAQVALDMAAMALDRLAPGGRAILYTGSPIVEGRDALHAALDERARTVGAMLRYRELDPDVFGEELEKPAYASVDRIALVAAVLTKPR